MDLVNILCIPRAADLVNATEMRALYGEASNYIAGRRGFLLVDIPERTASLDAMQTWLTQNDSLRSNYSAVYFPRTFVPDPVNGNRFGMHADVAHRIARGHGNDDVVASRFHIVTTRPSQRHNDAYYRAAIF